MAVTMRHEMHQTSMIANVISFSATISAQEKGAHWEQSLALLHKMRHTSMTANVLSFSRAISVWEQAL